MAQGPMPTDSQKVWFITGASSGFGKRLALSALKRGDFVISTSRSPTPAADLPKSTRMCHVQLDVCAGPEMIKSSVDQAVAAWGRIDVCVNNAGTILPALLEEAGSGLLRQQLQTNLFGLLDVTTAVLPHMRARRSGTMVMLGSRSSWRTDVPGLSLYSASKVAVRTLGETLAVELEPFNVKVLIVEPGAFRTEGMLTTPFYKGNPIPDYDELRATWEYIYSQVPGTQPGDPAKATEIIVDVVRGEGVAEGKKFPLYLPLGKDSEAAIREKCEVMLDTCEEWKDVIRSTDFDEEK